MFRTQIVAFLVFLAVPFSSIAAPSSGNRASDTRDHSLNAQSAVLDPYGTPLNPEAICIPETTRQLIGVDRQSYIENYGPLSEERDPLLAASPYPFYPQGGTMYVDLTTGNFVDLDPNAGSVLNYLCKAYGNDTHQGSDTGGGTWEEMAIGQPVFAALPGTVVDARDGDPDMNTSCEPGGNWVIIDHGNGREAWYFHLKKNSVLVSTGQHVEAGQQLGLVGSSGCSFGPHLHFQSMQNSQVFEPFAGACRAGSSGWEHQVDPPSSGAFVRDMGVTIQNIGNAPPLPWRAPVDNQIPLSAGGNIYYWIQFGNLPANSQWHERYLRPNGTIEYELGPFPFSNPTDYQFSQYWFPRWVGGMANTTGTWRIQFEVNGKLLVDAPVKVVSVVSPSYNQAPEPITVNLDPSQPDMDEVVFARVAAPSVGKGYRDQDWNIVRYHYVWRVNGETVRDVTSAGMADALPANFMHACAQIQVTVTAGDGFGGGLGATAAPVTVSTRVGPAPGQARCPVGPHCFLSGTQISMSDGSTKPIELIQAGDLVRSFDESSGSFVTGRVVRAYSHQSDSHLVLNGRTRVTSKHRFYLPKLGGSGFSLTRVKSNITNKRDLARQELKNGEWVEIGQLKMGSMLLNKSGQLEVLQKIEKVEEPSPVYNFEVSPYQTYIADGYVVHNRKLHDSQIGE